MERIKQVILTILAIAVLVLLAGFAGQLDHDEYIEANLTPKSQGPYKGN